MSRLHHKCLVNCHDFEVLLDKQVLHPVLAYLACLSVCYELVGIESYGEVQIIVNHYLEGFSLSALALVLIDGLSIEMSFRAEAVSVDASVLFVLFKELRCKFLVELCRDVAQCVFQREHYFLVVKHLSAVRCSSYSCLKFRFLG